MAENNIVSNSIFSRITTTITSAFGAVAGAIVTNKNNSEEALQAAIATKNSIASSINAASSAIIEIAGMLPEQASKDLTRAQQDMAKAIADNDNIQIDAAQQRIKEIINNNIKDFTPEDKALVEETLKITDEIQRGMNDLKEMGFDDILADVPKEAARIATEDFLVDITERTFGIYDSVAKFLPEEAKETAQKAREALTLAIQNADHVAIDAAQANINKVINDNVEKMPAEIKPTAQNAVESINTSVDTIQGAMVKMKELGPSSRTDAEKSADQSKAPESEAAKDLEEILANAELLRDGIEHNDDLAFNKIAQIARVKEIKDTDVIKTADADAIATSAEKMSQMLKDGKATPEELEKAGKELQVQITNAANNSVDVGDRAANPTQVAANTNIPANSSPASGR